MLLDDLKLGIRTLVNRPRAYAAAFLTLTVGLAAAITMFSVVSAVVLEPLPYAHGDRLTLVWDRSGDNPRNIWPSPPEFADLRERARAFDDIAAMTDRRYTLTGGSEPEDLQAAAVSPNLFDLVGAQPRAGRLFRAGDDLHGSGFVAVVAEPLAERIFGSAAAAVGRSLTLDGQAWIILGVVPRQFAIWPPTSVFPQHVDVWVPIDSETYTRAGRNQNYLHVLARLKPGVAFAAAADDVARVGTEIAQAHPEQYRNQNWRFALVDFREHLAAPFRPALLMLFGAVGLLVLVACANVANLLLARAGGRTQEMAVRAALGASRVRLFRQVLTESAVLGAVATAAAVVIAAWAITWIARTAPGDVPRLETAGITRMTIAFSALLALVTTAAFGAAPAWQLSHARTSERLKDGVRGSTGGPRARRLRALLVVAQIATAVVLMIATGLLVKGFAVLTRVDSGFSAEHVATGRVRLPVSSYATPAARAAFFTTLTDRLASRPDVAAVGAVTQLPMSGAFLASVFAAPPGGTRDAGVEFGADLRGVTTGYFEAMRIRLVDGRTFQPSDRESSQAVAVVDQTLARRFWPGGDAVGRTLHWIRTNDTLTIVGVVSPVRHYGLAAPPRETVYRPYAQYAAIPEMFVEVRAHGAVEIGRAAIADEVRRLDPSQPVADLRRLDGLVEASLGQPRFDTQVLAVFATMALALSIVGIYGVIAFGVSERTREIGVRVALGADPQAIVRLIAGDGARMIAAGIAIGGVAAALAARTLRPLLFGLTPWDMQIFIAAPVVLTLAALIATYVPARRAARLDPTDALR